MTDYFDYKMDGDTLRALSNLGLAHMGDAVYELMVRARACASGAEKAGDLHKVVVSHVSAPAQAEAARNIRDKLTDGELAVFKRGRNTRVNSVPHGATIEEYHLATALEALFGWLYLSGRQDRANELFDMISREWTDAT